MLEVLKLAQFNSDFHWREEFSIVPTVENEKNKSPILYHEHNLGLEEWCIKYVYNYAHMYLLKVKPLIQKRRLNSHVKEEVNKILLGALLIKPDVVTFWNIRRELVIWDIIDVNKELLISKLILSSKPKSNETFAYRKWVISRLLKYVNSNSIDYKRNVLNSEFAVTEITASKSPNNYHAWNHRIWSIQNIGLKFLSSFLHSQLDFSLHWIFGHVSEHTGYNYRQYLINHVRNFTLDAQYMIKYYKLVYENLGLNGNSSLKSALLGDSYKNEANNEMDNYLCILLYDLFSTVKKLNVTFPDHEAVWYHRRFLLYSLIKSSYEFLNLSWTHKVNINEFVGINENVTSVNLENPSSLADYNKFQDNGEIYPKLFKGENNRVECTFLYKFLIKLESEFVLEYSSSKHSNVQNFLAKRHQKWLRYILGLKDM